MMDKKQTLEMIAAISNANGAPGFEDDVVAAILPYARELGETQVDRMRNLFIRRRENTGDRPVVQLDAHSDEVGFMVQAICPNGTLRIIPLGGWISHNVPAHKVWVRNREGAYIPGLTASKPPHFMSAAERNQAPAISDMVIDVGASSAEEVRRDFKIRIGAPVVPDVTFTYQEKHDLMMGKAFDCRLGCCAIVSTLEALSGEKLNVDVVGAMSVQEEVGTRGAFGAAFSVTPEIALVLEGTTAADTPALEPDRQVCWPGKGPVLSWMDGGTIYDRELFELLRELAEKVRGMLASFSPDDPAVAALKNSPAYQKAAHLIEAETDGN